ncbi:MAG: extra-cytoplasmic solute receptor BugT [Betaproteobacteria bacterium]|nr:extra-cytoplasmic solute receptor BugT [Betaproteobacteria bacterium]
MTIRMIRAALALCALSAATATFAQPDYPTRPIRFLVGVVPGGAADTLARTVGQRYSVAFNQQVIVDNRVGANQTIATDITAKAAPDGYTIVIVAAGHAISPALYKLPYDVLKDFSAIGFIAAVPNVLVVHPGLNVRTAKDFIALARSKPGAFAYGSSGIGSASHLSTELFQMMTKLNLVHVPYKGQSIAMVDLISGQLQLGFPSVPASIQHIRSGKMIALGVASKERSSALPDVPALDQTVPGYEVSGWYGVLAPAKTPAAVVTKLNNELNRMLQDPATREILSREGADPLPRTPGEFTRTIADDVVKWAKVVKTAGLKVE